MLSGEAGLAKRRQRRQLEDGEGEPWRARQLRRETLRELGIEPGTDDVPGPPRPLCTALTHPQYLTCNTSGLIVLNLAQLYPKSCDKSAPTTLVRVSPSAAPRPAACQVLARGPVVPG